MLPGPVHIEDGLALLADVEHLGSFRLHGERGLHGLDGGFELRILLADLRQIHFVQLVQEGQIAALDGGVDVGVGDVGNHFGGLEGLAFDPLVLDVGALIDGGKERRTPQRAADRDGLRRAQHDVTRQIGILAAQTVGDPRTHRRTPDHVGAGVHQRDGRLVIRNIRVHRADDADVFRNAADIGPQLAHFGVGFAVARELERRLHQVAGLALRENRAAGQRLPVVLLQHRLGIEGVHVRHAAVREQENDPLGARLEVQLLQHSRSARGGFGGLQRTAEHVGERHHAEAPAHLGESLTARKRTRFVIARHVISPSSGTGIRSS